MLRELSNEAGEVKTNDKNISAVLTSLNDKFFQNIYVTKLTQKAKLTT